MCSCCLCCSEDSRCFSADCGWPGWCAAGPALFLVCRYRCARSIACEFVLGCAFSPAAGAVLCAARSICVELFFSEARSYAYELGLPDSASFRISEALVEDWYVVAASFPTGAVFAP